MYHLFWIIFCPCLFAAGGIVVASYGVEFFGFYLASFWLGSQYTYSLISLIEKRREEVKTRNLGEKGNRFQS